jgi:hypothetical protein
VLVVAGAAFGLLPRLGRPVASAAATVGTTDYDPTAPAGLVALGVLLVIIGATRANSDLKP